MDLDNDRLLELAVAYDTGEARKYKNLDGNQFKLIPNPITGNYGYPMGIPACYIILSCLILGVVSHSSNIDRKNIIYYIGLGIALLIATIGTLGNVIGILECPKTETGMPMCYLSFIMFLSLLILKQVTKEKGA